MTTNEPVRHHPDPAGNAEVAAGSLIDFLRCADSEAIVRAIMGLSPKWWAECRAAAEARTAPYRVRVTRAMLEMPVDCYVDPDGVMEMSGGAP